MKKKPLVSILIASYNKQKFVKRCIKSCLTQTYKNIEIIFVDDNSSDRSYEEAKTIKKIKVFKNKNKKVIRKFNTYFQINTYLYAFKKSKGSLIMFLDSDDFFKKIKVQKIVNAFEKSKDYQIIFDKPFIFFSKKNFYKKKNYKNSSRKYLWPKFPPQSCITIKRNFFKIILNEIKKKEFSLLTLDFRLAVLSCFAYNNFIILDEYLTYYFQDKKGETNFKFKKFNINWWVRRKQAHDYVKYIHQKYKKDHSLGLDYFVTNFIVLFIKLFGFK